MPNLPARSGSLKEYMPLDDTYRRATVFVRVKVMHKWETVGTGFFVVIPNEGNPDQHHCYVVTAAHVVDGEPSTFIRFRAIDENIMDKKVAQWVIHPTADVAVAEIWFDPLEDATLVPFNAFLLQDALDLAPTRPRLGTTVYFIGQLGGVPSMDKAMIPMVRSGTIGAMNQPVRDRKGITRVVHLIDCKSFYGFSGSPCVCQELLFMRDEGVDPVMVERTRLMGLLTAHFDDTERQMGEPTMKIHVGVGIVQPVERVRELIYGTELQDLRRDKLEELSGRTDTLDSLGHLTGEQELSDNMSGYERFESLPRAFHQIPKLEGDELRVQEKEKE